MTQYPVSLTPRETYQPTILIFASTTTMLKIYFTLCSVSMLVSGLKVPDIASQQPWDVVINDIKVPVQLGVMSRCPDALLCENTFNQVLQKVSGRVDLSLIYVAKYDLSFFVKHLDLIQLSPELMKTSQTLE